MAEIVYGVATSLDGFVAAADGGVDWLQPFGAAGADHFNEFMKSVGAILMGSRTYEQALTLGGVGESFGKPCFVFSSRKLPASSPDVTITSDSPAQVVAELDRRGIKRAWHFGGTRLFTSFREAGLITEYSLGIVPVVLGGGLPLFESPGRPARLQLIESRAHRTGVLMVRYQVVKD
jgi:dihydrofolate reductase